MRVAATDGKVVVADQLTKVYGSGETEVVALDGVSVAFDRHRFTAIMGPSGSGKSTLMHILAGLDTPSSGTVTLDGVDITHLDDGELTKLRRDKLGFVFQFFNLLPVLTAEENLVLPLSIAGRKPDRQWVDQLIRTVGLEDRRTHRPSELSGGQQQRVAVARALARQPQLLIADEPTAELDLAARTIVLDRMLGVAARGGAVILATHDAEVADRCDHVLDLRVAVSRDRAAAIVYAQKHGLRHARWE